jgi:hypothetical protein
MHVPVAVRTEHCDPQSAPGPQKSSPYLVQRPVAVRSTHLLTHRCSRSTQSRPGTQDASPRHASQGGRVSEDVPHESSAYDWQPPVESRDEQTDEQTARGAQKSSA